MVTTVIAKRLLKNSSLKGTRPPIDIEWDLLAIRMCLAVTCSGVSIVRLLPLVLYADANNRRILQTNIVNYFIVFEMWK